jgi:hypothetical protein
LFSDTKNLCSSLRVSDHIPQSYNSVGNSHDNVLYIHKPTSSIGTRSNI